MVCCVPGGAQSDGTSLKEENEQQNTPPLGDDFAMVMRSKINIMCIIGLLRSMCYFGVNAYASRSILFEYLLSIWAVGWYPSQLCSELQSVAWLVVYYSTRYLKLNPRHRGVFTIIHLRSRASIFSALRTVRRFLSWYSILRNSAWCQVFILFVWWICA